MKTLKKILKEKETLFEKLSCLHKKRYLVTKIIIIIVSLFYVWITPVFKELKFNPTIIKKKKQKETYDNRACYTHQKANSETFYSCWPTEWGGIRNLDERRVLIM